MHEDFLWFVENYDALKAQYGDVYLAIKDKMVLGVYKTCGEGVRETQKTHPLGTFIVQECSTKKRAYEVRITSMNFA